MYHADKHVIKMILESAQILSTALSLYGLQSPYKKTHIKHPCVLWAMESIENWQWLKKLLEHLNEEYMYRWNKSVPHKSFIAMQSIEAPDGIIPSKGITVRPQVMPEKYMIENNPIQAYRNYYLNEKQDLHKYTKRSMPHWLTEAHIQ